MLWAWTLQKLVKGNDHAYIAASKRHFVKPFRTFPALSFRSLAYVGALLSCLAAPAVFAQNYYVVPFLTVETLYDDNVLLNPETQEQTSDVILRVSPRLDVGYDSETLNWLLTYRNDAEWYRDLSFLDSTTARGFGRGDINYTPNRRLSLNGAVDYIQTNSAEDITLIPGQEVPGRVGRADAERFGVSGGVDYLFTQNLTGGVDVQWVNDKLIDVSESETATAIALLQQSLAADRDLLYGYRYRDFEFSRRVDIDPIEVIETTASSHTPWLGYTQRLSETSDIEVRAGPRFAEGENSDTETDPYFLFRWTREYDRGNTSLTATWDETTVLAETGPVDAKTIRGSWIHNFTEAFEFGGAASYADVSGTGYEANNASVSLFGNYRINRYVFLSARYRYSLQDVERSLSLLDRRINQNVISVAITFTRPRPGTSGTP
jgi:hypothetical protein